MKRTGLLHTNSQKYALAGALFGLLFPLIATVIQISISRLPLDVSTVIAVQAANPLLWIIDSAPFILSILAALAGRRQDTLEKVNHLLKSREKELENTQISLEQLVDERTRDLTLANQQILKRMEQLRSVVSVSHSIHSIQELDRLLPFTVQIVSQYFNPYYVGIYLLDEQKQYAVLLAASGDSGKIMLARNHRLKLGGQNPFDFVFRSGQARMVEDTLADATYTPFPELADARSELVLPLKTGEIVIGVLDFQSNETRSFTWEDVTALSILADQVTIAIQNAILHEGTRRSLREAGVSLRQVSDQAWSGWLESLQARGYRYDGIRAEPLREEETTSPSKDEVRRIPVQLRGRSIGNLTLRLPEASQGLTVDDLAIVEATAERAALALEGARLLNEAQKRAARESFLSDIAAKLSTSFQMDSILRDTVEELGRILEGSTVSFRLINPSAQTRFETPGLDARPTDQEKP